LDFRDWIGDLLKYLELDLIWILIFMSWTAWSH